MHAGLLAPIYVAAANVSLRCIVLLDGVLRELPTAGPTGARVRLDANGRFTTANGGNSLVLDTSTGWIREAAPGETVLTP